MATDWDEVFKKRPDLSPPDREEAVKRALQQSELKQLAKSAKQPSRRGRSGGRSIG